MKTKFTSLFTLLLLTLTLQVSGQEKQFNGLLNIAAVSTGGSSDYTITTVYSDESGTYSDTDVAVGDIVWDRSCKTYKVEAITQTGIPLILEVSDINGAGEPTAGLGVIFRQTTNKNYPLSVAGAPATLSACIQSHLSITLDKDINTLDGNPGGGSQTLLNGTSDPDNSTGNDGDFYINTATNTLFGPKASGSWPSGTSIKGEKGDTGDQGPAGTGVTIVGSVVNAAALPNPYGGNTGDMYITQDDGHGHVYNGSSFDDVGQIQGPKGDKGDTGDTGAAGAKGDKGDTGDTGATGATGPAGADGKTVLNGTTDPAAGTGSDGDFYINTTTNTLFGPKTGGNNWGTGISITGAKGDTGDTGPAGAKGDKGDTGDQGPAGTGVTIVGSVANAAALPNPYSGNTGDMYITQDDGHGHVYNGSSFDDVGQIQGPKGDKGDTGDTGAAGAKGDKGDTGDTGATGAAGPAGADGKTVLNGTTNPAAGTGSDGDFYINTTTNTLFGPKTGGTNWGAGTSIVGPKGDTGDTGAAGAKGDKGDQGDTGATGATGAAGANGTDGANGKTILNGTTDPAAGTGSDGDFYINTTTNTLFGPKTGGTNWGAGTSIVGPKGDTGDTGAAGAKGDKGDQGDTGATGATGAAGANGKTILNGTTDPAAGTGVDGDFYINTISNTLFGPKTGGTNWGAGTSIVGPKGDTGDIGAAGAKGDKGDQGDTGATGATGAAGANGTDGADGKTILNGTTDPAAGTGVDGDFYINTTNNTLFGPKTGGTNWGAGTSLVGPKGDIGDTGAAGAKGDKGDQGDTGATGAAGANGTDGADGKTILNGTTDPAAGTGVDGDFYINTTSNTLFGPKTGGTNWGAGTSLVGPTGATGATGTKGDKGDQGDTGATGATGAAGANGTDGADGKTILNGTTDPAAGTGVDGDFYINTTSNTLFGPKTGGTNWGAGTSLVGPKGDKGDPGADGGSIQIYDAGNGAIVRASATGITFSITNSVGTLVVPDGTRLFSVSITGNSTADITVGTDFSIVLDYANGNDMNATDFSNFFAPTVSIINAATQPFGGPTDALSFTYDTALQKRITGLSNGDLTIKIVNLGSTYTDWSLTIAF